MLVKVHGGNARSWHWVVAESHGQYGLMVRDAASPLVGLRNPPMDVCYGDVECLVPYGSWIWVVRPGTMRATGVVGESGVDAVSGDATSDDNQSTREAVELLA